MALSKRAKWVIGVLIAIPCLVALAWLIWDWSAGSRLKRRLAAIREAGEPVALSDLADSYPPVPHERNAAVVLDKAFGKFVSAEDQGICKALPIVGQAELPELGEPIPAEMLEAVRKHVKANAGALRLIHEAAGLDECRFEIDFSIGAASLTLPHLSRLRIAARLLALEAIDHTESGRAGAAARSLLALVRVGRTLRHEPVLISGLVRTAIDGLAVAGIERWVSRARPPAALLPGLEEALGAEADPEIVRRLFRAERCMGIDMYYEFFLGPAAAGGGRALGGPFAGASPIRFLPRAYFKADLVVYLDFMAELIEAAAKPYPESLRAGVRLCNDLDSRIPRRYLMCRTVLPAMSGIFRAGQSHMARLESARVALAALRYRARHGALPASLWDLVPDFADAIPPDPFTGRRLRYRKSAQGFVVYAVGQDACDDGGKTQPEADTGHPPDVGFRVRWPKPQTARPR